MPTRIAISSTVVNAFRRGLVRWYRQSRRRLPWRRECDPYRIWVSEVMLQQTRVATVIPYYHRWLRAFPNVEALARARLDRVLKSWEGLGYYSRARHLHQAAQQIVRTGFPRSAKELRRLPGIGRYTAGAVASIAFGERIPVVDGNVARVLCRVFCIRDSIRLPSTVDQLWRLADSLVPAEEPGDFNQAMMELGALICLPRNPQCSGCPLRKICLSPTDELPNRGSRRPTKRVVHNVLFAQRGGRVLLQKRPATGLLANLWELPSGKSSRPLLTIRHAITDSRISLRVYAGKSGQGRWFTSRQLRQITMPAAHRRALVRALSLARRVTRRKNSQRRARSRISQSRQSRPPRHRTGR